MSKEVSFKNRDRFVQLGIAIAALRKMRGLSQEKLAERAGVSRSLISTIEAPNMAHGFSLDVFFRYCRCVGGRSCRSYQCLCILGSDLEIKVSSQMRPTVGRIF